LSSGIDKLKHLNESFRCVQNDGLWTNKTKFTDLDVDCQLQIFDQLNFPTLLSVAELNSEFSILAAEIFRRKYRHKTIKIQEDFFNDDMAIIEFDDAIQIENFDLVESIFKHFGEFILNVNINFGKIRKYLDIIRFVNNNSDSLKKLRLEMYGENVFDVIEKPFANVEYVCIVGECKRLGNDKLNFSAIFPKMRRLTLKDSRVTNRTSIDLKFPHLEHLNMAFLHPCGFSEDDIKNMIEKNPQLRSLSLHYTTLNFLQFLSQNLHSLEYLDLPYIITHPSYEGYINFNSVKRLEVRAISDYFAKYATFEQLHELELDSAPYVSSLWIEFIGRITNLTKLKIIDGEIHDAELAMLTDRVPNLIDASLILGAGIEAETIVAFLQRNINLNRVNLIFYQMSEGLVEFKFNILRNAIENNWKISKTMFSYLIERI